jgi:hypothetical protein
MTSKEFVSRINECGEDIAVANIVLNKALTINESLYKFNINQKRD